MLLQADRERLFVHHLDGVLADPKSRIAARLWGRATLPRMTVAEWLEVDRPARGERSPRSVDAVILGIRAREFIVRPGEWEES